MSNGVYVTLPLGDGGGGGDGVGSHDGAAGGVPAGGPGGSMGSCCPVVDACGSDVQSGCTQAA